MSKENEDMIKSTWDSFRDSGLLWMINTTLHVFGWAIATEYDEDGNCTGASPYKTKFRGFSEQINDEGYKKVTRHMRSNLKRLIETVEED